MFTQRDGIVTAIAVLVLVIGTATGNAYAMLAMAVAGLALSVVLYRRHFTGRTALVVLTAAVVAFAAGIALSVW